MKFTDPDLGMPESETEIDETSYNTPAATQERSINSLFGRLRYSFMNKYYGGVSFRYDGSSKFAENYRWGFSLHSLLVGVCRKNHSWPDTKAVLEI